MLGKSKNMQLMQVGEGTPMGNLLRRYWLPIAGVSEFDDKATKPVRIMGEDLVLYKDLSGTYGLMDRHCPHRRADLSYGYVEECGLRCNYHGWLYDETGQCIAQPYEDMAHPEDNLKAKIKVKAYPVEANAGLLWAYMGPAEKKPLLPNWEPFTWANGFRQVVLTEMPCNWFQCAENCIDPIHFEWMHSNWAIRLSGKGPEDYIPTHTKIDFKEHQYGLTYHRVAENTDEDNPLWTIGRMFLWPNCLFTGDHFEWRVPIDDENTLSVGWFFNRVPKDREPYDQGEVPTWHGPLVEEDTGRWITSHVMNQDFVAWVGQGTLADRSKEHLGRSDKGVAMARKQFFDDMELLEKDPSADPKGLTRDEKENECVELPVIGRANLRDGQERNEIHTLGSDTATRTVRPFPFQTGQPDEVRKAFEDAMGVELGPDPRAAAAE